MAPSKLQAALVKAFLAQKQHAFNREDLHRFLVHQAGDDRPVSLSHFLAGMVHLGHLSEVVVPAEKKRGTPAYKSFNRYVTPKASELDLALALRHGAYLSHATAAENLGLLPPGSPIYANKEQSEKPASTSTLSQEGIDRAFTNAPRTSRYVFLFRGKRIVLLSGKNTGDYGVVDKAGRRITGLERTLVDMTVRPAYAGGPAAVLHAYQTAVDKVSISKLVETLRHLDHAYPYHQAVGFYMQRAGKSLSKLKPLSRASYEVRFHLCNQIKNKAFDQTWQIYYPNELS
jgi:hypothetical protein